MTPERKQWETDRQQWFHSTVCLRGSIYKWNLIIAVFKYISDLWFSRTLGVPSFVRPRPIDLLLTSKK